MKGKNINNIDINAHSLSGKTIGNFVKNANTYISSLEGAINDWNKIPLGNYIYRGDGVNGTDINFNGDSTTPYKTVLTLNNGGIATLLMIPSPLNKNSHVSVRFADSAGWHAWYKLASLADLEEYNDRITNLENFINQFPATDNITYGIKNRKPEEICGANEVVLVDDITSTLEGDGSWQIPFPDGFTLPSQNTDEFATDNLLPDSNEIPVIKLNEDSDNG